MSVSIERLGPSARAQVEADMAKPRRGVKIPRANDKAGQFLVFWKQHQAATRGLPKPIAEHEFAPPRLWRFDWAWPSLFIAVEVDGGRWMPGGGKHGGDADRNKLNVAASLGWRVFRVAPDQLAREAPEFVEMVAATVREASR